MKPIIRKPIIQKQNVNQSVQKKKRIPMQVNRMGMLSPRGPRTIMTTKPTTTIQPRKNNTETKPKMTMVHQRPPAPRKGILTRMVEEIFTTSFRTSNKYAGSGIRVGKKVKVIKK